jgi:hypothetical protein
MTPVAVFFTRGTPSALPMGGVEALAPQRRFKANGQIIIARGAKDEKLV